MTASGSTAVFIYGSCVSRDSFEYLDPERFRLVEYVARQSLASAFAPAGKPLLDTAQLASQFQRRVLELDAASGLPERLETHAEQIDVLLWDLFDERLGYYESPDGGVATNTVELIRWGRETGAEPTARLVPFGSREHLRTFVQRLHDFADLLDRTGLRDRLVLVAPSWAARTEAGAVTPSSFGLSAPRANLLVLPYLQAVHDVVRPGLVIDPPASITKAATDHQWGVAPFHYVPDVYRTITAEIEALVATGSVPAELARRRSAAATRPRPAAGLVRRVTRFLTR